MEASSTTAAGPVIVGGVLVDELARNALGLPQVLFCIVTGAAPLAAMMFNDPLAVLRRRHRRTRRRSGSRRSR